MDDTPKKVGRPTKYDPEYHPMHAENYCLLGCTTERMAELFGVATSTVYLWMEEHAEFSESVRAGKEVADAKVSRAMYEAACGYTHQAIRFDVIDKVVNETPYAKHYPPDTGAAMNWLKNRQPDIWRDKTEVGITADDGMLARMAEAEQRVRDRADK